MIRLFAFLLAAACWPGRSRLWRATVLASGLLLAAAAQSATINNTASVNYEEAGQSRQLSSNTTTLDSLPGATPGVVRFWQHVPAASAGSSGNEFFRFDGAQYDDGGSQNFLFLPGALDVAGNPVALTDPVEVRQARVYHAGEPVFMTLADANRNTDPNVREYIEVLVTTSTGDREVLRLYETGPNTGVFAAAINSTTVAATQYDGVLTLGINSWIRVDYQDIYYPTDVSQDTILVDPFGIVFDSDTGQPVNGAVVTMINTATGLPATVFGDDGVSLYPPTIVTGSLGVTDSGGTVYNHPPGSFRFPFVAPGSYRFQVTPPTGYAVPSQVLPGSLPNDPNGNPYAITTGSYTEPFIVVPGPALNIDIPADPAPGGLRLEKQVSLGEASAGDFLQYRLTLRNLDTTQPLSAAVITDVLPRGMRFRSGSLFVAGAKQPDPVIASDGRTLTITIGNLGAGARPPARCRSAMSCRWRPMPWSGAPSTPPMPLPIRR